MFLRLAWYWWVLIAVVLIVIIQYARMKSAIKDMKVGDTLTLTASYFPFNGEYKKTA